MKGIIRKHRNAITRAVNIGMVLYGLYLLKGQSITMEGFLLYAAATTGISERLVWGVNKVRKNENGESGN